MTETQTHSNEPPLQIHLLGGFQIVWEGERLEQLQTPLFRRLLAFLILHRQTAHSRQYVAFLLWPDVPEKKARRNLRQLLFRLRRSLPAPERFLDVRRKALQWRADAPFALDVAAFEEAASRAGKLGTAEEIGAWERAIALYKGDLLPGLYDEWVLDRREALHQQYLDGLHRLAEALAERGAYRPAIAYARRLLEAERLRESTYLLLLRLHIARGDRAGALRVYEEAADSTREAFGVAPGARLQALHEQALALPAAAPGAGPPVHLPAQPTPFVGREEELAEIGALLGRAECRLLTLNGLGGSGKSRLALEAARRAAGDFPGGVYFVPLSAARSRQELLAALASALAFSLEGTRPPLAQLQRYLRRRRLLLLLDSCERVREAPPVLADLLSAAPQLHLLVTSRQVLNLRWEWRFPVRGLALPPDDPAIAPSALAGYDAVALFVQMAQHIRREFALTEANGPAVARICRLVEGLPLALELAAVWLREYGCAQIAAQIAENVAFLETPLQDLPPRQRTLCATFDYSWRRLTGEQQRALSGLAVFPAPFTAEAARAVVAVDEELLGALRARSLVQPPAGGESDRYGLHDLLREYALERLEADKREAAAVRERHAAYYLQLLAGRERELRGGPRQQAALERVGGEVEQVLAAWRYATANELEELLQPATFPLFLFLQLGNRYALGREIFCEAPHLPPGAAQYAHRQAYAAYFLYATGAHAAAGTVAAEALSRGRLTGDPDAVAAALQVLARLAYTRGAYRQAGRLAEEALACQRSRGDRLGQAAAYNLLGLIYVNSFNHSPTGRPLPPHPDRSLAPVEKAQSCLRRARALYREAGNEQGEAIALHNLGYTHLPRFNASDDPEEQQALLGEMITYLEEAVSLFRQHERYSALAQSLNWLGHVHARWLDRAAAVAYFREALAAISRTDDPMILVDVLSTVAGRLWLPAGHLADAAALLVLAEAHPAADVRVRRRSRRQLAEIEEQLPAADFAAAAARGRRLTAEAAAEEAWGKLAA